MLTAAAVCPHPPLLVHELETIRSACADAVATLAPYDVLYVAGADSKPRATSLRPWGLDVAVDVPEKLPLAHLVGGWLTRGTLRSFVVVDPADDADDCAALGKELAESANRVALLVMADGSARHDVKAPGYLDDRAAAYDETVAEALKTADWQRLLDLDAVLSDDLLAAGRVGWQTLAGAARGRAEATTLQASFAAPYGVGYHVAAWTWPDH